MKLLMCKDFGVDCPAEFRGETVEDVLEMAKKHGMASHGQTKDQVEGPEVRRIAEEKAREV